LRLGFCYQAFLLQALPLSFRGLPGLLLLLRLTLRLGFCYQAFLLQALPLSFRGLPGLFCLCAALSLCPRLSGLLLAETFDLGLLTSPLFFLLLNFCLSMRSGLTCQPFNVGKPCFLGFLRTSLCLGLIRLAFLLKLEPLSLCALTGKVLIP
jgi:hypothetical protein